MSSVQQAKSTKATKATKQTAATPAPVEQVVAAPATTVTISAVEVAVTPATAKRSGKKAKTEEQTVEQVVAASAQVPQVADAIVEQSAEQDGEHETEESFETFDAVSKAISEVDKQILALNRRRVHLSKIGNKLYAKETRQLKKRSKNDGSKPQRAKSGFNKSAKVPDAFCKYLGIEQGSELPRTTVTALLYKHIKDHNMLNANDKREILADAELKTLLCMKDGENLRFENFQHFVSRVYKAEQGIATSETQGATAESSEEDAEDVEESEEDE